MVAWVYCGVVFFVRILSLCIDVAVIFTSQTCMSILFLDIARLFGTLYIVIVMIVWTRICWKHGHLHLSAALDKTYYLMGYNDDNYFHGKVSIFLMVLCIITLLSLMRTFYGVYSFILSTSTDQDSMPQSYLMRVQLSLRLMNRFYNTFLAFLCPANFCFCCYILSDLINRCNSLIKTTITKQKQIDTDKIEEVRQIYEHCLQMLHDADRVFCLYLGMTILVDITGICLLIYFLASTGNYSPIIVYAISISLASLCTSILGPMLVNMKVSTVYSNYNK